MHVVMWNTLYRIAISIMLAGTLSCCIKNDIPFAKVPLSITGIEVEGQSGSAVISESESTVTVTLQETVNPKKVMLKTFTYTEKASSTLTAGTEIDLSQPYEVTLSLYQDYKWKIIGNQPIARRMIIDGQLGNSEFDTENHLATASIRKSADLKDIVLSDLKLGPEGALNDGVSGAPEVQWTFYRDFAQASVHVTFSDFVDETWTLRVYKSDKDVVTESADGWVNVAWLYGAGVAETECGFDIREDGSEDWTRVDQKYVTMDGGQFTARVPHLKANTTYECRAYSGNQVGDVVTFSTTETGSVPNMGFEDWIDNGGKNGKAICPWSGDGASFWDTGNHGSTTVGTTNVTVYTEDACQGSKAAKLSSQNVFGIFAAGNLFVGEYKKTDAPNGVLGFGREFKSYPTRLKGMFKYQTASITQAGPRFENLLGTTDECIVWVALGDWNLQENVETGVRTAVEVRTDKGGNNGQYFDKNDPHIIAYGEMTCGENVNEYTPFSVELEYRATNRKPTALLIVCSASKYGDYFTGAPGATMWVDDFSLEYDYDD